ncbi:M3 family oligoendopeptidase [Candidatus Methanomassiliicoccus intestinalis]|uniref:M3 family oligoendopeptidase n=1 Tax=Candidatus Methanomassiliicoccus intestinalis TaxID=1406512 RepID=UPI0037DD9877
MKWDLTQLAAPETIEEDLKLLTTQAEVFQKKYQGQIAALDAEGLRNFIADRDAFYLKFEGPLMFARLAYYANALDPQAQRLGDLADRASTEAAQKLAFASIELGKLLEAKPELIQDPLLAEYHHYLELVHQSTPHRLSEEEEKLVMAKDLNGVEAWSRLQSDWLSTRTFEMEVDGQRKTMPYGEIIKYYQDANRELRKTANSVVYSKLGADDIVWSSALRSICDDHLRMCALRQYADAMDPSLEDNDVDQETITALMQAIEEGKSFYQRYLGVKAKLLGLDKLGNWDLMAPLPDAENLSYSWDDSRREVVAAYSSFDQQFGDWIEDMFAKKHIDGEVRRGKTSGAFCSFWYGGQSAYVLQSFNGQLTDVYTQAHELGHAVHAYLGQRAQKPVNFNPGSCIAECGSIFGELLLTKKLLADAKTPAEKRAVLCVVLDEFGMAAFQVTARFRFEQSLYKQITMGKFLDGAAISELWTQARDSIYGDAVDWLPEMQWEWTMKMHYYIPNYRYYNYPYVFAQLFVFALYRLYLEEGEAFVPKLKKLLAAGSSQSPAELAQDLGFDIHTVDFWKKGIAQAESFLAELEKTL